MLKTHETRASIRNIAEYLPDSETEGLPADLSEFLELAVELVDEAVPSEHSETLRRFERRAAAAAAPGPQEEPVGALELSPWRPWRPWRPCRPVWFVSCSSRRLRNLCSRDSCSLCTACLRSRSSRLCNHNYCTCGIQPRSIRYQFFEMEERNSICNCQAISIDVSMPEYLSLAYLLSLFRLNREREREKETLQLNARIRGSRLKMFKRK